jgi:hypothetical protein
VIGSDSFGLTPTISYTWSRVTVDGYTETGGGFPVTVGRSVDEASEGRLGLTGRFTLAEPTTLRLRGEYIHRFDRFDGGPAFQIIGTGMGGVTGGSMRWTATMPAWARTSISGSDATACSLSRLTRPWATREAIRSRLAPRSISGSEPAVPARGAHRL